MRICSIAAVLIAWLLVASPVFGQFKKGGTEGPKLGESRTSQWRIGLEIKAGGGACNGGAGYASVPAEWPEQDVQTVKEDVTSEIKINYSTLEGGVKLMNLKIGPLNPGQEAHAIVTFEVRRSAVLPPEKTDDFVLPDVKKLPRDMRVYLTPSVKIESRDPKIRDLAKKTVAEKTKAWDKVEAIYDFVREKLKYKPSPLKGAVAALRAGEADCEDMTSLFIAMCRAVDIPARTVWVPEHCYPEFYLNDEKGAGHWFPCQIAGAREFGGISELRPIFQKGDNIRPPVNSRERRRYLDFDLSITGKARPEVHSIREAAAK
jgi:hypothetical protein